MKRLALWFTSLKVKVNCFEIMSHLSCLSTCDAECVWNKNDLKTREVWLERFFSIAQITLPSFPDVSTEPSGKVRCFSSPLKYTFSAFLVTHARRSEWAHHTLTPIKKPPTIAFTCQPLLLSPVYGLAGIH